MELENNNDKIDQKLEELRKYKEIELLQVNIERLERERSSRINKTTSIEAISILCVIPFLTTFLFLNILNLVLGGLVLAYKPINDKRSGLQWTAGFLCILPVIFFILIPILFLSTNDESGWPISLLCPQFFLFLSGAICSLIFIVIEKKSIQRYYQEKIDEIDTKIRILNFN